MMLRLLLPEWRAASAQLAPRSWVWSQRWLDVLFLHWRVPVRVLRAQVPKALDIDAHGGDAWVSLVLFRLQVRPRWFPYVPGVSTLVEANLRTYVRYREQPGIWFLSVHGDNPLAVRLGRWLSPLPYVRARMSYRCSEEGSRVEVQSLLNPKCALSLGFRFGSRYSQAAEGTRAFWLLERYRLYVEAGSSGLKVAEVWHAPWETRAAEVTVAANTFGAAFGLDLARAPEEAHFSAGVQAKFGAFREIATQG